MVTFWCPARRVTLWHLGAGSHNLPFLPFADFGRVCTTHSQCNYLQYNSDTDSGEGGQSVGAKVWVAVTMGLISRGWDGATLATRHTPVIRNGLMPHLWGINLLHIYACEVRWNFEFNSWYSSKICSCLSKKTWHSLHLLFFEMSTLKGDVRVKLFHFTIHFFDRMWK